MEGRTLAWGKPVSSSIQSDILNAPSLNQTASPSQPVHVPSSELAKLYAQLLYIAQQALQKDQTLDRREQLLEHVAFYDRAVNQEIDVASAAGAPVPNLPGPPPAPESPAPGPGAGPMPNLAAPPAPNPGAPLAPPPPGGLPAA